jgi:hypothetical protein
VELVAVAERLQSERVLSGGWVKPLNVGNAHLADEHSSNACGQAMENATELTTDLATGMQSEMDSTT